MADLREGHLSPFEFEPLRVPPALIMVKIPDEPPPAVSILCHSVVDRCGLSCVNATGALVKLLLLLLVVLHPL